MTKSIYSGRRSRQNSQKGFFEFRYSRDRTTSAQAQMLWTLFIAVVIGIGAAVHFRNSSGPVEKLAAHGFSEMSSQAYYQPDPFYFTKSKSQASSQREPASETNGFEAKSPQIDSVE